MARANKTKIVCTAIKNHGIHHEYFCDQTLMLRKIRNVGDTEIVNNYVLSILRKYSQVGEISFTEEKINNNSNINLNKTEMAKGRKPRAEEVKMVFDNLKYCSATELNEVIKRANELLESAKKAEIEATEKEIAELQKKLESLKK